MKGQFNSIPEFNMKLELIEIDCDGVRLGIFRRFSTSPNLLENKGDFIRSGSN